MEKRVICRRVRSDLFQKLVSGIKTCWIQEYDQELKVGDLILFQELRGDLLTGRALEIVITNVEVDKYCPEGTCLISFQHSSGLAKISIETYFGLFEMFSQLRQHCDELEKANQELIQRKEVTA